MTGPPALPQAHSLMPLLTDRRRLKHAARGCMRTTSSPGADGMTWREYRAGLDERLQHLAARLQNGTWRPGPTREITWDSDGKTLTVAIPMVEDRIVHRALRHCAEPILEAHAYPDWLFGWRLGRTRVHALTYAQQHGITSPCWVADVDVTRATAGGTTEQAVGWLAEWIHDGSFLHLVRQALDGLPSPLAPGSGLTPLLTNLRLLQVDRALAAHTVVRVTDNYAIFCSDRDAAHTAYQMLTEALAVHDLAPHPRKSKVWRPNFEDLFLAG
ncbi:Retron-type reverse transcriptase [Amycolatopsis sp. NPDC059021]|uniref:Retron-type reverse transcriptase n=1 Tax=Amycolatopsis sp. NPDC059021 TaxID=3346704 RepID=UPI00366EE038